MNFLNYNITLRRPRTYSDPNKNNVSEVSTHTVHDESVSSMPDLSNDESQNELIDKLKQQIKKLESELSSAHQEIETLSIENTNLKCANLELLEQNNVYKTITQSPIKKIKTKTPLRKEKVRGNKQIHTSCQLQSSPTIDITNTPDQPLSSTGTKTMQRQTETKKKKPINKIHILSTNTRHKILSISQNTFPEKYEICHYLKPNCNTEQLINNLETKIQDFTMNDFCVILIGEEDFKSTHDYFSLILYIREVLQKLNHTNIIICAPTFKYGHHTNMFNWRVANFNNLLYFDILEHEHAYFLDSNRNLKCSYEMFNIKSGTVNNVGVKTIFEDIRDFINGIIQYDLHTVDSPSSSNQLTSDITADSLFFRN